MKLLSRLERFLADVVATPYPTAEDVAQEARFRARESEAERLRAQARDLERRYEMRDGRRR